MKTLLTNFKTVQGLDSGALCRHLQPYIAHVHEQGYKLKTIRAHVCLMANFNRWLIRMGRELRDLNETTIEAFLPRAALTSFKCGACRGVARSFLHKRLRIKQIGRY